jgi:hypothetical protein
MAVYAIARKHTPRPSGARGSFVKVSHHANGEVVLERVMPVAVFWRWLGLLEARSGAWVAGHHRVQFELHVPARLYRSA